MRLVCRISRRGERRKKRKMGGMHVEDGRDGRLS